MRKNKNSKKIVLLIVIIFLLLLIGGTGVYFMLNNKGNKPIKINYNDYYSKYVTTIGEVKLYTKENDGYKIRWFNEEIYICEYLNDGLTANFYEKRLNSIESTCFSYNKLSSFNLPKIYKLRYKINYFRYGLNKYNVKYLLKKLDNKELALICSFIGYIAYVRDKITNK